MSTFTLIIHDIKQTLTVDDISDFIGEDGSGGFGIKSRHARFMTTLISGLCRFRRRDEDWQYLALSDGVLYFRDNELSISTRHFMIDSDYERIGASLVQQIEREREDLRATRHSLIQMERSLLLRLWNLRRYEE